MSRGVGLEADQRVVDAQVLIGNHKGGRAVADRLEVDACSRTCAGGVGLIQLLNVQGRTQPPLPQQSAHERCGLQQGSAQKAEVHCCQALQWLLKGSGGSGHISTLAAGRMCRWLPGSAAACSSATPLKLAAKDCSAGTPWMATGSPCPTHVRFANAMPSTCKASPKGSETYYEAGMRGEQEMV